MRELTEAELDDFEADMVRLSRRIYAEVGVAMFLVPEDLTGGTPAAAPDPEGEALAEEFAAVCAALERRNGPLSTGDIAQVLEVLADRSFLPGRNFSDLSDVEPRA